MFVGACFVLVLGGCTLLVGGCTMALQEGVENMDADTQKEFRQRLEERGHSKRDIEKVFGASE